MNVEEKQASFIRYQILIDSVNGAFQRNHVYAKVVSDEKKRSLRIALGA